MRLPCRGGIPARRGKTPELSVRNPPKPDGPLHFLSGRPSHETQSRRRQPGRPRGSRAQFASRRVTAGDDDTTVRREMRFWRGASQPRLFHFFPASKWLQPPPKGSPPADGVEAHRAEQPEADSGCCISGLCSQRKARTFR